ncbi:hypothetical protein PtrSN002B_010282 [Pyrenophora tritici-repentis]|uniref:Helo-N domain containing protein n=1 Tax=Pyrenophora tritici-repentis TaxID=45151 RepID=A0A2W1FX97_9PLEO|nr:Helo-like-N domain-containing protein [Pyrenophora tritici-repentis]KAF7448652.1 Helo N domain containing protein [Pyrenophora tritici-repentis]KAF7572376.1 hypothetical protein PtrM4_098760 [Pyrenophora tritici-repentis]KAG9384444.1 Helo N domain containing protein [Pyrenophora tritici-repentis]KAI0570632.1 Helo-like-N domain-containing protein [Pyrenophora tritici-repentis]
MDPISTAASVVTLLGAAAGTIKVIHDTINSIIDAPKDIQRQSERLRCLSITLAGVVQTCKQLPDDCQLNLELCGIDGFIQDAILLEVQLKARGTRMIGSSLGKVHESCKWLLFDRQLKRFFESLDQWNTILLQTLGVIQMLVILFSVRSPDQMLTEAQGAVESNIDPHVVVNEPPAPYPVHSTDYPTDLDDTSFRRRTSNDGLRENIAALDAKFTHEG